ncbi:kinase-like domain, phloem protein 2-like protein [Tanacetum coccineum]
MLLALTSFFFCAFSSVVTGPRIVEVEVKVDLHSADDNLAPRLKNMCEAKLFRNNARSKMETTSILLTGLAKTTFGVLYSSHDGPPYANGDLNMLAQLVSNETYILSATNNFAEENKVEIAEFGNQYQGQLLWSGELITICARRYNKEWSQREQQFRMEISMLSSLKHKNLVSLVGFCDENDEKIIIIKFETEEALITIYVVP